MTEQRESSSQLHIEHPGKFVTGQHTQARDPLSKKIICERGRRPREKSSAPYAARGKFLLDQGAVVMSISGTTKSSSPEFMQSLNWEIVETDQDDVQALSGISLPHLRRLRMTTWDSFHPDPFIDAL
ncbi:3354_t:CDS:2, partial [Acaulospora colombiana]